MSTEFLNPAIDVGDLPQVDQHAFEPLHPNFLRAKMAGAALTAAVVAAITVVVAIFVQSEGGRTTVVVVAGLVALFLVVLSAVLQRVAVRYMGYLVREHDLSYRYGVLSRTTQTIPFSRVQHVSIDRGPVERRLGLATLRLRSAGGVIAIAGLSVDAATSLREVVVARADVEPEDSDEPDAPGGLAPSPPPVSPPPIAPPPIAPSSITPSPITPPPTAPSSIDD